MSPVMAILAETMRNDIDTSLESQYHKGVKHLYESGITRVPKKYILPAVERPNGSIRAKPYNASSENINLNLPVIDFAELHGANHAQVISLLAHACENYGFFQVINHGISSDIISKMKDAGRKFFELPLAEREKYMSTDIHSLVRYGTSFNQTKDGVFCWRDFLKLVCHNLSPDVVSHWPSSPSEFREMGARYARETKMLFLLLVEAILESLGLGPTNTSNRTTKADQEADDGDGENDNGDYNKMLKEMEDGSQLMVVNCYPPCPEPDLTLGMPPHSDYGFLTLLLQDEVEGLQILFKDRWVTVQPLPNSFVVNVGDHLENCHSCLCLNNKTMEKLSSVIFSNGKYKSVLHRVLVNSMKYRLSVASLHSLPFTSIIRPAEKLITETNRRQYKDTDFADFVHYITTCDSKRKNFLESRKLT